MGEVVEQHKTVLAQASEAAMVVVVDTMGGRMHVRWDESAQATPHGQIAAEFLATAGVRGDAVAAQALGLKGLVSEDSVRRALKAMVLAATEPWMREALMHSVPSLPRSALELPWMMDIDATVTPLYGHQEGAEIGYNPYKPGRPSHVLHTFWVSNLRLVLDAQLSPGKEHSSGHAKAALLSVWPAAGRTGRAWPGAGARGLRFRL